MSKPKIICGSCKYGQICMAQLQVITALFKFMGITQWFFEVRGCSRYEAKSSIIIPTGQEARVN
jgi:hypothetical protein